MRKPLVIGRYTLKGAYHVWTVYWNDAGGAEMRASFASRKAGEAFMIAKNHEDFLAEKAAKGGSAARCGWLFGPDKDDRSALSL